MDTVRISDVDRQRTAERLHQAVGEGRLDLTAYEERVQRAYAAVTRADLDGVTRDLPAAAVLATPPTGSDPGRAAAWRSWLGVSLLLLAIWAGTSLAVGEPIYFWPVWPIGSWAAVMLLHVVVGRPAHAGGCGSRTVAGG